MKLLIAIDENIGIDSKLSEHFGHCPYFAIYETDMKELKIMKNNIEHSNQHETPVDQIIKFGPDAVFSLGMGSRAINLFNEKKIKVKTGNFKTVKEVIENIDKLEVLESCGH